MTLDKHFLLSEPSLTHLENGASLGSEGDNPQQGCARGFCRGLNNQSLSFTHPKPLLWQQVFQAEKQLETTHRPLFLSLRPGDIYYQSTWSKALDLLRGSAVEYKTLDVEKQ